MTKPGMTPERLAALRSFFAIDCHLSGVEVVYALERAWEKLEGFSPLEMGEVELEPEEMNKRSCIKEAQGVFDFAGLKNIKFQYMGSIDDTEKK